MHLSGSMFHIHQTTKVVRLFCDCLRTSKFIDHRVGRITAVEKLLLAEGHKVFEFLIFTLVVVLFVTRKLLTAETRVRF